MGFVRRHGLALHQHHPFIAVTHERLSQQNFAPENANRAVISCRPSAFGRDSPVADRLSSVAANVSEGGKAAVRMLRGAPSKAKRCACKKRLGHHFDHTIRASSARAFRTSLVVSPPSIAEDRLQQRAGIVGRTRIAPQPGQVGRGAQFEHARLLAAGDVDGPEETGFRPRRVRLRRRDASSCAGPNFATGTSRCCAGSRFPSSTRSPNAGWPAREVVVRELSSIDARGRARLFDD